jgi:hypothetical protein
MGLNCARGMKKWTKSEIRGTGTVEYSSFMNDFRMSKGEWITQPRVTWVALPKKEGRQG